MTEPKVRLTKRVRDGLAHIECLVLVELSNGEDWSSWLSTKSKRERENIRKARSYLSQLAKYEGE